MLIPGFNPYAFSQMSQRDRMVSQLQGFGLGALGLEHVQYTNGGQVGTLAGTSAPASAMLGIVARTLPAAVSATTAAVRAIAPTATVSTPSSVSPNVTVLNRTVAPSAPSPTTSYASPHRGVIQTQPDPVSIDTSSTSSGNPDAAGSTYASGTDVNSGDVHAYGSGDGSGSSAGSHVDDSGSDSSGGGSGPAYAAGNAYDPNAVATQVAATAAPAPSSMLGSIPGWAWGLGGLAVAGLAFKLLSKKR